MLVNTIKRDKTIQNILQELNNLKIKNYAINFNIRFFKHTRSKIIFFFWLFKIWNKVDSKKLLEINEFEGFEKYDEKMHLDLIKIERKEFPGLIKPLVESITDYIKTKKDTTVIINFGSGGGETERQIISNLKNNNSVLFICVDKSEIAHKIAKNNLLEFSDKVIFFETENLNKDYINSVKLDKMSNYKVIFCKNDIFTIQKTFKDNKADIVFHTLFQHHLTEIQKIELEKIYPQIACNLYEYDGYKSFIHAIPQTFEAWQSPIFLNASIISNLRYSLRREIKARGKDKVKFFKIGTYLLKYCYGNN